MGYYFSYASCLSQLEHAAIATAAPAVPTTHSPVRQQTEPVAQDPCTHVFDAFWQTLAVPPPAAVTWHTPHVPTASATVPAALAVLPQNGAIVPVHEFVCGGPATVVSHCCYPQYET